MAPDMSGPPLSSETIRRLEQVFAVHLRAEATVLLTRDCGSNLPLGKMDTAAGLERIRFAALKFSKGTIAGLVEAIYLAQADWRDLLVAAEFADDVNVHLRWLASELS